MPTVTVSVAAGDITITPAEGSTAADAVSAAFEQFGVADPGVDKLGLVVNGQDAHGDQEVKEGDHVAAAPRVRNG